MSEQQYRSVDKFHRKLAALAELPVVTHTKPTTITIIDAVGSATETFIVQTYRQAEVGDCIALTCIDEDGCKRVVLPPRVAEAIARQRDALTTKVRKKVGKAQAAERKARGERPAFLNGKKRESAPTP